MNCDPEIRAAIIGCGQFGRNHIKRILSDFSNTSIVAICEPSSESYSETVKVFESHNRKLPPNIANLDRLLIEYGSQLDAALVTTPHVLHCAQAKSCLEAGLDVLVEKPMSMNTGEAIDLINTRDRTGRELVVAFQGSLSPHIRKAVEILRSEELGQIRNISGVIWQNWATIQSGKWRGQPEISGGGFMFDTGAHMLNTVSDLADQEFTDIWAIFNNHEHPVEVTAVIMGRLKSGALVTINACGDTAPSCASDLRVFCEKAALRTGVWGDSLEILWNQPNLLALPVTSRDQGWEQVALPQARGVWEQFLAIRDGSTVNSSPPEKGLRMARLWDAIKQSATHDGSPVRIDEHMSQILKE